jgi:Kae1-associated kinase Bud32
MLHITIESLREHSLDLCQSISGNRRIIAACLYGPLISGYGEDNNHVNILLVLRGFGTRPKTFQKLIDGRKAFFLIVDQDVFQNDVSAGRLGEITADKLLIPYDPVVDSDYLCFQEVALKKRIIWEILEALVSEFPELSQELLIKQEYFMHETQMQRAKLFPPIAYRFLNIMRSDIKEKNVESMMKGYRQALEELSQEKWITMPNGMIKVTPKLVKAIKSRKIRIPIVLRSVQRLALRHIFSTLPKMMTPLTIEQEIYAKTHIGYRDNIDPALQLEDPKNHLLVSTPLGPVPLSDASTIEDFVRTRVPGGAVLNVETRQIGGVLNAVYQLTLQRDGQEQKIVVKKFKDWTGFKWFPLTLWSLGTKSFAVLGKSRLEREYALNQYLKSQGIPVPTVLYISPKQSLIFTEFVEGKTLTETVKKAVSAKHQEKELKLITEAGRKIAEAHRLDVSLGDCKPENIIVTKEEKLCFVDLEQASRDGNQVWDIAEFLYYSGHYVPALASTEAIELVAKAFLEGYIEAGGSIENVQKAASPRYTKVFSIFTQPHVILAISNLCRKMGQK